MRQRLTYLLSEGSLIDVSSIKISDGGLNYTDAAQTAGIEQRTTLSLIDLPNQIRPFFQDIHELHIRYTAPNNSPQAVPLVSRLPAGLHVFYTPKEGKQKRNICDGLKRFFDTTLKCDTVQEAFSRPPILSERFASSATYQYHHVLEDLSHFHAAMTNAIDDQETRPATYDTSLHAALSAAQIDIDYDVVSHALVVNLVWSADQWRTATARDILASTKLTESIDTIEIGVLGVEKADDPEELKLGGFLTVLGEDSKPSPTLFGFPSRHHPLPALDKTTYNSSYLSSTGLHPTMAITFQGSTLQPPDESCALHAYLTLPSALFLDRYQLSEPELLASKNLVALHALSGADDLEAPDWAVKQWGLAALLELKHPSETSTSKTWQVEVPLHLRYLQAENDTNTPSSRTIAAPWPIVFWACQAEEGLKMSTNPFDRVNLGYDGLFGPKTMFYHIPARGDYLVSTISVPTLDPATMTWLPYSTLAVVTAGFLWIIWSLVTPLPSQKHAKKE